MIKVREIAIFPLKKAFEIVIALNFLIF